MHHLLRLRRFILILCAAPIPMASAMNDNSMVTSDISRSSKKKGSKKNSNKDQKLTLNDLFYYGDQNNTSNLNFSNPSRTTIESSIGCPPLADLLCWSKKDQKDQCEFKRYQYNKSHHEFRDKTIYQLSEDDSEHLNSTLFKDIPEEKDEGAFFLPSWDLETLLMISRNVDKENKNVDKENKQQFNKFISLVFPDYSDTSKITKVSVKYNAKNDDDDDEKIGGRQGPRINANIKSHLIYLDINFDDDKLHRAILPIGCFFNTSYSTIGIHLIRDTKKGYQSIGKDSRLFASMLTLYTRPIQYQNSTLKDKEANFIIHNTALKPHEGIMADITNLDDLKEFEKILNTNRYLPEIFNLNGFSVRMDFYKKCSEPPINKFAIMPRSQLADGLPDYIKDSEGFSSTWRASLMCYFANNGSYSDEDIEKIIQNAEELSLNWVKFVKFAPRVIFLIFAVGVSFWLTLKLLSPVASKAGEKLRSKFFPDKLLNFYTFTTLPGSDGNMFSWFNTTQPKLKNYLLANGSYNPSEENKRAIEEVKGLLEHTIKSKQKDHENNQENIALLPNIVAAGPPGTGKTTWTRELALELEDQGIYIVVLDGADIFKSSTQDSQAIAKFWEHVDHLAKKAYEEEGKPTVLLMQDAEPLFRIRDDATMKVGNISADATQRFFLKLWTDGGHPYLMSIITTNLPEDFDDASLQRISRIILFNELQGDAAKKYITSILNEEEKGLLYNERMDAGEREKFIDWYIDVKFPYLSGREKKNIIQQEYQLKRAYPANKEYLTCASLQRRFKERNDLRKEINKKQKKKRSVTIHNDDDDDEMW